MAFDAYDIAGLPIGIFDDPKEISENGTAVWKTMDCLNGYKVINLLSCRRIE